jgi:N-methylhydantoinase A
MARDCTIRRVARRSSGEDATERAVSIGVDTGGTFTDLVAQTPDGPRIAKLASTPDDPARAVIEGLARLGLPRARVVHGTTVALNALLTGRVARTTLVTNRGLADVLEIGRQDRPELYALHPVRLPRLVPRERCFEVAQRSWPDPDGRGLLEVERPSRAELARLRRELARAAPESIAIGLLHSWADPAIEERVAAALAPLGVPLSLSSALHREYREVERFSTAVVNAALVPVLSGYLVHLARALDGRRLDLLQSAGGTISAQQAAREPVRVLLSGPAGGVLGAAHAAREAGFERMVGLDLGGTSADVSTYDHGARTALAREALAIAGQTVAVPSLDIHTIGCGGGSLLRVERGALRVGPESAGADPGPVAYGRSDEPTLTDAHVLLGHVEAGAFLGGALELDHDGVARAFERLGARLGVRPREAAAAALDVARASMRRALSVMTMQRGQDPRGVPLVAFGGGGGLHAAALAEGLGMPAALVPRGPGVLSAWGMAQARALADLSASVLAPLSALPLPQRASLARELARAARARLVEAGHAARALEVEVSLALRYAGQSFELELPDGLRPTSAARLTERFHAEHERRYGWRLDDVEVELVHLRVRAISRRPWRAPPSARARALPRAALLGERALHLDGSARALRVPRLDRARLEPGHRFEGPALVEEYSGTTLVPPGWHAKVTPGGHLVMRCRTPSHQDW